MPQFNYLLMMPLSSSRSLLIKKEKCSNSKATASSLTCSEASAVLGDFFPSMICVKASLNCFRRIGSATGVLWAVRTLIIPLLFFYKAVPHFVDIRQDQFQDQTTKLDPHKKNHPSTLGHFPYLSTPRHRVYGREKKSPLIFYCPSQ